MMIKLTSLTRVGSIWSTKIGPNLRTTKYSTPFIHAVSKRRHKTYFHTHTRAHEQRRHLPGSGIELQKGSNTNKTNNTMRKTAGVVIIGNEILSGKFKDENIYVLGKFCTESGLRLCNVSIVEDDYKAIADAVRHQSENFDFVFTSGGIGSTHDDITYDAIAKTFGVQLEYHQPTLDLMTKYVKSKGAQDSKFSEEHKRMAYFPEGSKVHQTGDLWVPLVVTKNVHILPGVPILFSRLLELHGALFQQDVRLTTENLWSTERESDLAAALGLVQGNNPGVTVGSYPRFTEKGIQGVLLSFEGEDPEAVKQAVTEARASIKCEDTIPAKHITN